jgi:hypothetical protein
MPTAIRRKKKGRRGGRKKKRKQLWLRSDPGFVPEAKQCIPGPRPGRGRRHLHHRRRRARGTCLGSGGARGSSSPGSGTWPPRATEPPEDPGRHPAASHLARPSAPAPAPALGGRTLEAPTGPGQWRQTVRWSCPPATDDSASDGAYAHCGGGPHRNPASGHASPPSVQWPEGGGSCEPGVPCSCS